MAREILQEISERELTVGAIIGEGAYGIVACGFWNSSRGPASGPESGTKVALKSIQIQEADRGEGARLLDVRRAVEEDLVEAQLAVGLAVEAAAEARPLVAREPFRERRWALLATALYRTGRQGEVMCLV